MVVTSLTNDKLVCKNGIKTLRLCSSHITLKMRYSKCGLCLQDLEVIKPASGIRYIRCLNCTCPFFCPEENINGYQHCIYDRVVPEYKVCEGGKPLKCKKKKVQAYGHAHVKGDAISKQPVQTLTSHVEERKCANTFNGLMKYLWIRTMKGNLQLQPRRNCKGGDNPKA